MGLLNWILGRDAKNVNVKAQLSASGSSNAARKNAALVPLSKGSKGSNSKKAGNGSGTDYVLEAQKLFLNMGLAFTQMGQTNKQRASRLKKDTLANEDDDDEDDSSSLSSNNIYRNLDILWRHETTRGCIFTGNERAASNLDILVRNKITSVINCTRPAHAGTLPNYHANTGRIRYYDFPVACWHDYILYDDEGDKITNSKVRLDKLTQFLKPMLAFVDKALAKGENVLIHCLAGAHRAGTTSIMCLMHYDDLTAAKATRVAKSIRPVIDPISDFPRLLEMFEKYRSSAEQGVLSDPIVPHKIKAASKTKASAAAKTSSGGGSAAATELRRHAEQLASSVSSTNRLAESLKQGNTTTTASSSRRRRRGSKQSSFDGSGSDAMMDAIAARANQRSLRERRKSSSSLVPLPLQSSMPSDGGGTGKATLASLRLKGSASNGSLHTLTTPAKESIGGGCIDSKYNAAKFKPRYTYDGTVTIPAKKSAACSGGGATSSLLPSLAPTLVRSMSNHENEANGSGGTFGQKYSFRRGSIS